MSDRSPIVSGLAATALLHLMVGGFLIAKSTKTSSAGPTNFQQAETIQASLAFKEVKPKTKQPQKRKKQKFKQKAEKGASKEEKLKPKDEKKDKTLPVEPDEVDINSILNKNRKQDEDLSDTGSDEVPVEGSASGSEWGTERDAKGDPYVGELKGRIYDAWKVPALETGTGVALGCVRLDSDGIIVDRELKKRSKNSNLDRSVEVALKESTGMESPVPDHLTALLTERGICIKFRLD